MGFTGLLSCEDGGSVRQHRMGGATARVLRMPCRLRHTRLQLPATWLALLPIRHCPCSIHDVTVASGASMNVFRGGRGVDLNLDHHRCGGLPFC